MLGLMISHAIGHLPFSIVILLPLLVPLRWTPTFYYFSARRKLTGTCGTGGRGSMVSLRESCRVNQEGIPGRMEPLSLICIFLFFAYHTHHHRVHNSLCCLFGLRGSVNIHNRIILVCPSLCKHRDKPRGLLPFISLSFHQDPSPRNTSYPC